MLIIASNNSQILNDKVIFIKICVQTKPYCVDVQRVDYSKPSD